MNILQTIVVKQIVTAQSKQELLVKFEREKQQYYKESEQLKFEMKKLEKANHHSFQTVSKRFEQEMAARKDKIKLIDFKIEQLHMLPLGSELKEKEYQAIVDMQIGDCWDQVVGEKTIIIKDGIVVDIR